MDEKNTRKRPVGILPNGKRPVVKDEAPVTKDEVPAPKPAKKEIASDNCEMCGYYEYDEEYDMYECTMHLDEDEMYNFITGQTRSCPYFQYRDEYRVVRHQM